MKGYITNIEKDSLENDNFRKVLYTAPHSQLVLMSLLPSEDIGAEVHELDQFIRVEAGEGKAVLNGVETVIADGSAIVVPSGTEHNIVNTGSTVMKLYTVYSPADHLDGTIHVTKADAHNDTKDHFDGITTEHA